MLSLTAVVAAPATSPFSRPLVASVTTTYVPGMLWLGVIVMSLVKQRPCAAVQANRSRELDVVSRGNAGR